MEFKIINYSGDNLLLFTADKFYDKEYLLKNIPHLDLLLNAVSNQGWSSSLDSNIYADKINSLIIAMKQALSPELRYEDFLLVEDVYYMHNQMRLPNYLYCMSLKYTKLAKYNVLGKLTRALSKGVSLAVDVINLGSLYSDTVSNKEIATSSTLYIGADNHFVCDTVNKFGEPVCEQPLGKFAKFVRLEYGRSGRSNDDTAVVLAPIPEQGQNGNYVTLHAFIGNQPLRYNLDDGSHSSYMLGYSDAQMSGWDFFKLALLILGIILLVCIIGSFIIYNGSSSSSGHTVNNYVDTREPEPNITI